MKSKIIITILLLLSVSVFAQLKIGPRVGVNLSNVKNDLSSTTTTIYTSYSLGGMMELGLGEALGLQVSLLASEKGYNFIDVKENKSTVSASNSLSFSKSSVVTSRGKKQFFYLDVPVNLIYKKDLGIGKVLAGAGAYYSYNIWGVSKEKNTYVVGAASDLSLSTINGTYDLKETNELSNSDFGLLLTAGLEFNDKAQLAVSYNFGLSDIDPGKSKVQNRVVNVSLVYFIKR